MSYPYQKHIWVTKEVIRREYLQNISDGIYDEQQDRLLKEGLLNDDIVAESNRAKQAEQNITNNLNAEILRAEEAEAAIARDLSSEISRSTTAEGELTDDVADLDARLLDESTRALAAENEISTALANEIARATNVENDLRSITTRAYKASGSVYFADLPALDVSRLGNVYDIKDAFTTTSDFVEGAGKDYPAGTNVAIVSVEGDFYTEVTPVGTENPSEEGWYVLDDGDYVPTSDTTVVSGTTYYSYADHKMMYDANSGFIDTSHFVTDTDYATSQKAGIMKPDGTTVTIDNDGTLHGSSGHIIKDGNGTSLTQRASLKFENCTVTDDSTNNQTVVTPTGQQITVDTALSTTSENPVQNKAITIDLSTRVKKYALSRYHNTYCKLGTCTNFANSKHLELHLKWAQGYETQTNANLQKVIDIYVEAGNNTTAGNNSWAEYHVVDKNINNSLVYIKWLSYTSFELYVGKASYSGDGYYTVISSGGVTWTHSNSDAGTDIPDGAIRLAADKKVRYMDDTISYSEISGTPNLTTKYDTEDSASTTINDTDYIPMSENGGTKKKTLWSTVIDKIKTALGIVSGGTGYLKKDGTWGTPANTTYTFATGDSNGQIKVTPSGGNAQNVDVKGLGSAAYTASTAYAAASHTHNYAGSASAGGPASYLTYQHGDEINFKGGAKTTCYFNYRNAETDAAAAVSAITYKFCNYSNDSSKSTVDAANFTGTAAVASKLGTSTVGSASRPIYLNGGTPTQISYTIEKSVPSNAVFTDTNTWRGIQNNLTSTSTTDSLSANQGRLLANGSARDSTKLPLSGGTMTGTIYMGNSTGSAIYASGAASSATTHLTGSGFLNLRSPGIQCRTYTDSGWAGISASTFTSQSSRRYKENIEDISEKEANKLLDIRVVKFDFKENVTDEEHRYNQHGVIAEETAEIIPQVVTYAIPYGQEDEFDEPVPDSVDYAKFVPYLIKMIQMQQKEIDELKTLVKERKDV